MKGGTLFFRLHDLLGAISSDEDGHSLGYFGEMMSYSGCAQLAPHIIHILQACERIGEARKWLGNHLSYHILRNLGVKLHWFHLWDYDSPPVFHMAASVSLILIPYVDNVLIIVVGMIGGMTHGLDGPIGS